MKAVVSNKTVIVYEPDCYSTLIVTDILNISYCLAHTLMYYADFGTTDHYFNILRKQKSIRAVVQKFNAICKALDL